MITHIHFIVWACDSINAKTGDHMNNTIVDIICDDYATALERAKKLAPGKGMFTLRSVIEHIGDNCGAK